MSNKFQLNNLTGHIFADKQSLGQAAAEFVAQTLRQSIQEQRQARLVVATGASQYEFLSAFIQTDLDWSKITVFHLDEYLGLSDQHPASFRRYLRERLFEHVPFAAVHVLQGDAPDAEAECQRYSHLLGEGPIDVACIGIGENGHLAFNDPPADFETEKLVHVVTLDTACRQQQVGEGHFANIDEVPQQALSMTIPAIMQAKIVSCVVPDARKAQAVSAALSGPITPDCPASILRQHAYCHLYLDTESASELKSI